MLGTLTVDRDGETIALNALMVRRVLAVLLCRARRPVSVDEFVDTLWPGVPPPTARKTLQGYVHRLRRAFGDGSRVRYGVAGYSIAVRPGELDAERFHDLVQVGECGRVMHDVRTLRAFSARQSWRLTVVRRLFAGCPIWPPLGALRSVSSADIQVVDRGEASSTTVGLPAAARPPDPNGQATKASGQRTAVLTVPRFG